MQSADERLHASAGRACDAHRASSGAIREAEPDPANDRSPAVGTQKEEPFACGFSLQPYFVFEQDVVAVEEDVSAEIESFPCSVTAYETACFAIRPIRAILIQTVAGPVERICTTRSADQNSPYLVRK